MRRETVRRRTVSRKPSGRSTSPNVSSKYSKKTNSIGKIVGIIIAIILISIAIFTIQYNSNKKINYVDGYIISVEEGQGSLNVIKKLADDDIIKSEFMTKLYLKFNPISGNIKIGTYELENGDDLESLLNKLTASTAAEQISFTLQEGETLDTYAKVLAKGFDDGTTPEDILKFWDNKETLNLYINDYKMLDKVILNEKIYHPLEGYLSPNTYNYDKVDFNFDHIDDITRILLSQREKDFEVLLNEDKLTYNKYTKDAHTTLTLASIVEREANGFKNQQGVAGVFINRLNAKDKLGSDVTTYYGVNKPLNSGDLTKSDLSSTNGYNTRNNVVGLPVGPIDNPSREAIKATLSYTESSNYFFVSDKNGKIYYTKTNAEHEQLVKKLKNEGLWLYPE